MGADVHVVIEKNIGDKWVGVIYSGCPFIEYTFDNPSDFERLFMRNYPFFALLAQVRGSGPDSEPPRGLPNDLSDLAKHEIANWGRDGHSHSWHTLDEYVKKLLCAGVQRQLQGGYPVREFFRHLPSELWSDYRVIFWFDN